MPLRGTGRTSEQLKTARQDAMDGIQIAFVSQTFRESHYALHLFLHLFPEHRITADVRDLRIWATKLSFIKFTSCRSNPAKFLGWSGKIVFDHAVFRDRWTAEEARWIETANGCNVRFPERTAGK